MSTLKGKQSVLIDLTGQKFGKWYVVNRAKNIKKRVMWNCICDCGKEKVVQGTSLKNGVSNNCGCSNKGNLTHGKSHTKIYRTWCRMKGCTRSITHEDYKHYGARGITMCDEWYDDFEVFYKWAYSNGYQTKLEIDRIDNNGNYESNNCRWTTRKVNTRNTRRTIYITLDGVKKPLITWCEEFGLSYNNVYSRINKYGWSSERALEVLK